MLLVQMNTGLVLNFARTKEMIVDFQRGKEVLPPLVINDQIVERVDTFKFLGTTICYTLKWQVNVRLCD